MTTTLHQLIDRGRAAFQARDYVAALADFREVLGKRPGFADVHNLAGLCLSFLGQPDEALEEFDKALALNDGYIEAYLNRAITLNELGRYEEAREAYLRAGHHERQVGGPFPTAVTARIANVHAQLGDLYLEAGAPADAEAQYATALRLRPEFDDIRCKLAESLIRQGQDREAEAELRAALEGNPRFTIARIALGLLLFQRGDHEA
ncbi:MAG: tetratricopeptide repeat protein, partial [Longimicrobiales bacterium]